MSLCSKFFGQANGAKVKAAPPQQTKLSFATKGRDGGEKEEADEEVVNDDAEEVESEKGMLIKPVSQVPS